MCGLPSLLQGSLTSTVRFGFLRGIGLYSCGPFLPSALHYREDNRFGMIPTLVVEGDWFWSSRHGWPFTISLSSMGKLCPLPKAGCHRVARRVGMRSHV